MQTQKLQALFLKIKKIKINKVYLIFKKRSTQNDTHFYENYIVFLSLKISK